MKDFFKKIAAFFTAPKKLSHIFIINSVALCAFVFFLYFGRIRWGYFVAIAIAVIGAIGYEVITYKKKEKSSFEWSDLAADICGVILFNAQVIFYLFK